MKVKVAALSIAMAVSANVDAACGTNVLKGVWALTTMSSSGLVTACDAITNANGTFIANTCSSNVGNFSMTGTLVISPTCIVSGEAVYNGITVYPRVALSRNRQVGTGLWQDSLGNTGIFTMVKR